MIGSSFTKIISVFETTDQFFFQILHQSSGSWDIIPLYFIAKMLCTLRSHQSKNLVKFYVSSQKSEILHFDGLLLSKPCVVSAKIVQKSYLSWHWTVIYRLKTNSLFDWKMMWEISWILTWTVKNLKIFTLMGCFLWKVCNVVVKNDSWFQKWHKEFGEFLHK